MFKENIAYEKNKNKNVQRKYDTFQSNNHHLYRNILEKRMILLNFIIMLLYINGKYPEFHWMVTNASSTTGGNNTFNNGIQHIQLQKTMEHQHQLVKI